MTMQTSRFLVDRTVEIGLLDNLLAPDARQRILLIQANAGFGKSLLLTTYQKAILDRDHTLALVDLRRGGMDAVDVLTLLCNQWDWPNFPTFRQEMANLATPAAVEVRSNWQVGINRSQINLPENLAQRRAQINLLTAAWFEDLHNWLDARSPAVILIDTYDLQDSTLRKATVNVELHAWVEDLFLTAVHKTPNLRLILAGQQTPTEGLTQWEICCRRHALGPIDNPNDWRRYAEHVGAQVTLETISAFCHTEGGHPFTIATKLDTLRTWSFSL